MFPCWYETGASTALPSTGLSCTSAPATGALVRPPAARWSSVDSSDLLLLLSLETEGLDLASQLGRSALRLKLLEGRVVSTAALPSFLVVVVLEPTDSTRVDSTVLLVLLHCGVGIGHASLSVAVVAHSVGLPTVSTVLRVVLVLILVVAVRISSTVTATSAAALVLVAARRGVVRCALVTLVIVVRGTVASALSHNLRVSESTLHGASELLRVSGISVVVADSLLLVSTHGIELVLGGSGVLGSVVEGRVGVGDGTWHARGNAGGWCSSCGGGSVVGSR